MSLILSDISHSFGAAPVVDGASLEVASGEIVCLFGPSGCGKTTLLRVAAGLEPLQAGRVELDGALLAGEGTAVAPEARPVGFVFQDYVLFPHLTALQNVGFGLRGMARGERRARALAELEKVGLAGLEKRFPHELSGGQQQRVALARAFARRPRAMLLDEPFASIDAVLRRRLREEMRLILKEQGAATILVTHDPEEALALGDRVAVIEAGRIIETAAPLDLFERPATIAGAGIFAGAQRLAGAVSGGRFQTPFGALDTDLPDGPGLVVVQPGGAQAAPDPQGSGLLADCRFVGPHWALYLTDVNGGETLLAVSAPEAVAMGTRFAVTLDPARVKLFPA